MPAPTDTFIQTIVQSMPTAMQPYGVALLLVACAIVVLLGVGLVALVESHRAEQRRSYWDKQLADGQRNERRPAHWGDYK